MVVASDLRSVGPSRIIASVSSSPSRAHFYGKNFHASALPSRRVLDDEPKASVYAALEAATRNTQKGSYGKIKHASELLKRIRPNIVASRCTSFQHFTSWLDTAISVA